ncbi:MAG: DMT family transporter [Cocleimonas sp.]
MQKTFVVYLIMLLPPIFWAGNFVVGRAVADSTGPLGLAFSRWSLALLFLVPFIVKPLWQHRGTIRKHLLALSILAILGVSSFNTIAYIALQQTTATNAILLNSFIPIFILVISGVFLKEKICKKQLFGVFVSLLGVISIISRLDLSVIQNLSINKGDLWMLLAALVWAFYSILLKYLRPKDLPQLLFLGVLIILGVLFLFPVFLLNPFNEEAIVWTPLNLKAIFYIALFPSIIATLSWNFGISKIGAAKGGQFIHLMPFVGAILAIVFLGETLELFHLLGAGFIALGLWLSLFNKKSN